MQGVFSSSATKKLLLQLLLENIDYNKKCRYLQEIIMMGKENAIWRQALATFFDTPLNRKGSIKKFSLN